MNSVLSRAGFGYPLQPEYRATVDRSRQEHEVAVVTLDRNAERLGPEGPMAPELGQAVRAAAARSGVSVSRWLSDAASDHLRNQRLGAALDMWEAEDGPFTADELDAASRLLSCAVQRPAS